MQQHGHFHIVASAESFPRQFATTRCTPPLIFAGERTFTSTIQATRSAKALNEHVIGNVQR